MEEADRFARQVVMISGATGGFGRALAQRFAQYGCRLSLSDIDAGYSGCIVERAGSSTRY